MSLTTIIRNRHQLGWIYRGSAYCQLIRPCNVDKRLLFAQTYFYDRFEDVIWSDETTIQLETHKRFCYRKEGEKPRPKPRPKHPVKVHVWAGISRKGPTPICIFEGIMNAPVFIEILERTLVPLSSRNFQSQTLTVSCKITTPSTHHVQLSSFTRPRESTGGAHPPNHQI